MQREPDIWHNKGEITSATILRQATARLLSCLQQHQEQILREKAHLGNCTTLLTACTPLATGRWVCSILVCFTKSELGDSDAFSLKNVTSLRQELFRQPEWFHPSVFFLHHCTIYLPCVRVTRGKNLVTVSWRKQSHSFFRLGLNFNNLYIQKKEGKTYYRGRVKNCSGINVTQAVAKHLTKK